MSFVCRSDFVCRLYRCEVLTAVTLKVTVFLDVIPYITVSEEHAASIFRFPTPPSLYCEDVLNRVF
jgi:hypothetical protein